MDTKKIMIVLAGILALSIVGIYLSQDKQKSTQKQNYAPPAMMEDQRIDTETDIDELTEQMKGFPCHQMGGVWMGDCDLDVEGEPTNR